MYRAALPNLFTIGNLFCGFLALHFIFQGKFAPAAWLIFVGAVLDKMDGLIARAIGQDSDFGIHFDSLVDVCTFGLAPALMIYRSHLDSAWGLGLAFLFLLSGAFRLARFNSISLSGDKGNFYLGLPIPTAAICLTQYVLFTERTWVSSADLPAVLLVLVLSFLMISRLDYDTLPNFRSTSLIDRLKQLYFIGTIGLIVHPSTQGFFFLLVALYIMSGVLRWIIGIFSSDEMTQHA
ncbi:MAG: CDP-diacylglycerol--serine O-phosphatidyltransferase [Candidatus Latescibacteria bacterium]|nr:CDP-diacylglycerol--serine O-phosphatidyltransferase [Candidatus Latescibacterota bacterium]